MIGTEDWCEYEDSTDKESDGVSQEDCDECKGDWRGREIDKEVNHERSTVQDKYRITFRQVRLPIISTK